MLSPLECITSLPFLVTCEHNDHDTHEFISIGFADTPAKTYPDKLTTLRYWWKLLWKFAAIVILTFIAISESDKIIQLLAINLLTEAGNCWNMKVNHFSVIVIIKWKTYWSLVNLPFKINTYKYIFIIKNNCHSLKIITF